MTPMATEEHEAVLRRRSRLAIVAALLILVACAPLWLILRAERSTAAFADAEVFDHNRLGAARLDLETLGAWHHVAMVWDGATIRVYVDGAEVGSQAAAGVLATDASMPVTIGGIASGDRQLDGRLDEVRVERRARSAAWIAATEWNQRTPGGFFSAGAVESGSWFGQGSWTARKPIAVDSDLVSVDAVDFPLLVQLTDADVQAAATVSGTDIIFTSDDGTTRLDHTIEAWDIATGALSAWVNVPLLSASVDTELFVYYGNPTAADQQDPVGVFGPTADLAFLGAS